MKAYYDSFAIASTAEENIEMIQSKGVPRKKINIESNLSTKKICDVWLLCPDT